MVLQTLVVVAVVAGFWLAHRFAGTLFTLFAAMVLGTAVRPGVEALQRRGVSRRMGALLLYAALLVAIVGATTLVVPLALGRGAALVAQGPQLADRVRRSLLASESPAMRGLGQEMSALVPPATNAPQPVQAIRPVQETLAELELLGAGAFRLVAILLLGFYWTLEGEVTVRALLRLASSGRAARLRALFDAAEEKVGGYVRGQLVVCAVTAGLSLVAFLLLGLPDALVLALLAGAMAAVPFVGGALAGAVALLAASDEPRLIPWVIAAGVTIHVLQEYVVAPRVMGKAVGVHPFTILLAISGLGSLLGLAGAVLAIPMAAILQLLLDRFLFDTGHDDQPRTDRRDHSSVLSLEAKVLALDALRQSARASGVARDESDEAMHMVESIAHDLDRILTAHAPATGGDARGAATGGARGAATGGARGAAAR